MKLSKREKVLICILIITLIIYAAYKIIPAADMFNMEELRAEYNLKSSEYNNMSQNILLKNKYEEDVNALSEEINNLNVISDLQQHQVIVLLNSYLVNNNIDANSINFTDAAVVPVNTSAAQAVTAEKSSLETMMSDIDNFSASGEREKEKQSSSAGDEAAGAGSESEQSSEQAAEQQSALTVRSITVNVSFESTYNDMIKFIDAIQNNPVDISITNISIVAPPGDIIQGTMTLNFYEIPKPKGFKENNKELIWEELADYGKSNPFKSDGTVSVITSSVSNYDFYVSIKPESSDLPTLIVGKAEDAERATYLYADSNKMEDVEFQFKNENNTYYYKYKTKIDTYPSDGWKEFEPQNNGSIYIKIYSSSRNSTTDSVGANISVTNTSGLKVRFEVEGDDSSSPRVYFKDPKSVIVTRK